jgi:pimeloyl-ACP methyl ester carboxylesterase
MFVSQKAADRYFAAYDTILRKWPVPAEELDVNTRFGSTRVRRSGTAGPPIVLLAGNRGTSLSWYQNIAELAARHQVHAVDSIGEAGRSTQTEPLRTNDDLANWLADVLAGLGHDEVHLAGYSRGGWLALNLASRSSPRIASVTAIDPAGFTILGGKFILWSLGQMVKMLAPRPILRRIYAEESDARHILRPLLFHSFKYKEDLPPQHVLTDDELRAITVPTRIVLAERSNVHRAKEVAARVGAVNPDIQVEIVPGATHSILLERPELITARLLGAV